MLPLRNVKEVASSEKTTAEASKLVSKTYDEIGRIRKVSNVKYIFHV